MAQTKLVARIVADQLRHQMQARHRPSGGTGIKRPGRRAQRDKAFKIKKFISNPKNVDIKHHGQVVRKMTVQRRAIYPSNCAGLY